MLRLQHRRRVRVLTQGRAKEGNAGKSPFPATSFEMLFDTSAGPMPTRRLQSLSLSRLTLLALPLLMFLGVHLRRRKRSRSAPRSLRHMQEKVERFIALYDGDARAKHCQQCQRRGAQSDSLWRHHDLSFPWAPKPPPPETRTRPFKSFPSSFLVSSPRPVSNP